MRTFLNEGQPFLYNRNIKEDRELKGVLNQQKEQEQEQENVQEEKLEKHGVLLINKPEGLRSHQLVCKIRKMLDTSRVGHCGILDPMASGLMVLVLGEATKISSYLLEQNKLYDCHLMWGVTTDTLDCTGKVLEKKTSFSIDSEQLRKNIQWLQGEHLLPVPIFSAAKVAGKPLHKYARQNQKVVIPKKKMCFHGIELLSEDKETCSLRVFCSKGSYIRSLVSVLGEKMGCGATLSKLCRLQSAPYSIDKALTLEQLEAYIEKTSSPSSLSQLDQLEEKGAFIPLEKVLPEVSTLYVEGRDRFLMLHGQLSYSFKSRLNVFRQNQMKHRNDNGHGCSQSSSPSQSHSCGYSNKQNEGEESPFLLKICCALSGQLLALLGWETEKNFYVKRVFKYDK